MKRLRLMLAVLCVASVAHAQEAPPSGPAQIIQRAGEARAQAELANSPAQQAAGEVPTEAAPPSTPPAGHDPHAGVEGAPPVERLPMMSANENASLRPGTIRVQVRDGNDRPVPQAKIQVGVMQSMGNRTTLDAQADDAGVALMGGLAVGDGQAYRVNVLHQGAKYSSNPFRLPPNAGYDVMVRQLDTTTDPAEVVLYIGATSIELQDERLKIVQQARLVNVGARTYVFPKGGAKVPLPKGFLAFQAQDSMTDQHVTAVEGQGVSIEGSIAPGQATLTWGYDLPREGNEAVIPIELPWRVYAYRVLADAAEGMTLAVDGMPAAERVEHDGHRLLVTEAQAEPQQPLAQRFTVRVLGIPGPGPARWVALGLALLALAAGLLAVMRAGTGPSRNEPLARKGELAAAIAKLDREHAAGDIGPEFHREERTRLLDELAAILHEERASAAAR